MRHGSLFSGIGGFDLAAEWMGWENVFHCEWNPFGQKVLHHYWPNAISYNDITKTDFTIHRGRIDILTGGFPCQPYSTAGKRLGKEDERHLWPEMLRAIREIQPRWIVGENVLGLVNWSDGLVFHEVQTDLEAEGYEVQPFVLPAAAVNAPHRRDRVWFVAYSNSHGQQRSDSQHEKHAGEGWEYAQRDIEQSIGDGIASNTNSSSERTPGESGGIESKRSADDVQPSEWGGEAEQYTRSSAFSRDVADTDLSGCGQGDEKVEGETSKQFNGGCIRQDAIDSIRIGRDSIKYDGENVNDREGKRKSCPTNCIQDGWRSFPSQSPVCDGNDGLSSRLDGITFSKWRQESIKAGGNAVVPQVVYQIFEAIQEYENNF